MTTLSQVAKAYALLLAVLFTSGAHGQRAHLPQVSLPDEIVVYGPQDIVVNGRARKCRPIAGDPLSKVNLSSSLLSQPLQQSVVRILGQGRHVLVPDDNPMTGPDVWQRAGRGLGQYVYHVMAQDRPICIGADAPDFGTFAQLRRVIDAKPFWGKRIRFTAWVATSSAWLVNFWLSAARRLERIVNGGNTNNKPWGGDHGWTPVMIEIGPVNPKSEYISYGFLLRGAGDVWVYKPELSVVSENDPLRRTDDVSVFGNE